MFFTRPGDLVVLRPLIEDSALIATAVANSPSAKFETGVPAREWFARRIKNQRIKNRKVSMSNDCTSDAELVLKLMAYSRGRKRGSLVAEWSTNLLLSDIGISTGRLLDGEAIISIDMSR